MRYTVGQDYVFMREIFKPNKLRFDSSYRPWEDALERVEIVVLTCTEHHKVAWDQDPNGKKDYDGFLFRKKDGFLWANQYPDASYGQLDDSCNWEVRRWPIEEDTYFLPFKFAQKKLAKMQRAIHPKGEDSYSLMPNETELLQKHLNHCIKIIQELGKRVHFHPLVFKLNDGTFETFPDLWDCTIL